MTRNGILALSAGIVTTVADMPEGWAPSGPMYMAAQASSGATLDDYQAILRALETSGLIVVDGASVVRITPRGREVAAELMAAARPIGGAA